MSIRLGVEAAQTGAATSAATTKAVAIVPVGRLLGATRMRHPLSTPVRSGGQWHPSERAVSVGDVDGLVVEDTLAQAVPEQLEPAVGEGAQGGVVAFAGGSFGVVELACPAGAAEAAEGPLLDGVAEVAVVGEPAGDDELALAGAPGDRRFAGVALERARRLELLRVVADLAGDPGGEAVTEARKAQVDLAAREALPPFVLARLLCSAAAGGAEQQLAHPPLPGASLAADREQLLGGEPDRVGLGADEIGARLELVGRERRLDPVSEALGPAMVAGAGVLDELLASGAGERLHARPALEQPQEDGRAEIGAGDLKRGREGAEQVLAEPVQEPPLVPGCPLVVAGDRAQLEIGRAHV